MARQLWLLRHAEAEPHGARPDSERRLTEKGESQARLVGLALARMDLDFEAVLTSPKVRARQTAELALSSWAPSARALLREHGPLAAGFDAVQALALAAETEADARILAVGHDPDFSQVIGELTGARVALKKGGVAVLRLEGTSCELLALLRPRELALVAGSGAPVGGGSGGD